MLLAQGMDSTAAKQKPPMTSLLPPGSLLTGVMLPRYDENRRLLGVLRAKTVTLVSSEILDGEMVSIELFNPDHSPRARLDLAKANFNQDQGRLSTTDSVVIHTERLASTGSGLLYELEQAKGFLMGPVTTRLKAQPPTIMHTSPSPIHATALLSAAMLVLPVSTTPAADVVLSNEASASPSSATAAPASGLREVLNASAEATRAATAFLEQEELLAKAAPATPAPVVQAKELDVKPGPNDTVINCDGGVYFDTNNGVLVYLKNVTVADPRFTLDGANEIKVFFEKKPDTKGAAKPDAKPDAKPAAKPAAKPDAKPTPGGMADKIGDVERVVATGAVHLLQKPAGQNEAVEAAGAVFTYDFKTGEIILSGGKPWVKKGGMISRAKQSQQTIRILEGKFSFSEGGTETILPLEQMNQNNAAPNHPLLPGGKPKKSISKP